jgi:hypothetical protein
MRRVLFSGKREKRYLYEEMRRSSPIDASRQGYIVEWSAVDDYGGPLQEAKQA